MPHVVLLPGDGIGPEIAAVGVHVLRAVADHGDVRDVDPALRIPALRMQEVVLEVDQDEDGAPGRERPTYRCEWVDAARHGRGSNV